MTLLWVQVTATAAHTCKTSEEKSVPGFVLATLVQKALVYVCESLQYTAGGGEGEWVCLGVAHP